ncbi:MAG: toll/interleukin-1 receptor domain-containing protein, partial [Acidimicrobiales bacterium]
MRVFVSYRRDDAGGHAGRLADDLAERLPGATVFHDVESIGPGVDFVTAIRQAIATADAVLVVIGPEWTTVTEPTEPSGGPRLSQPDDVVRLEVAAALAQQKWVIPVLVGAAVMPDAASLPADITALAHRNAVEIRQEAWDDDVDRLATALGAPA